MSSATSNERDHRVAHARRNATLRRGWIGGILAFGLLGCSSAPVKVGHLPASSASDIYGKCTIGAPMTLFGKNPPPGFTIDMVVTVTQRALAATSAGVSPSTSEYEVASVSIMGRKGSYPYAPSNFKFVVGNHPYVPVDGDAAEPFGPPLGQGTLRAGQSVSGTVAFEVPAGGGHVGIFDVSGTQICGWQVAN